MVKRIVVTGLKARGYVDGRYVGEEKKEPNARGEDVLRGRTRRGKSGGPMGAGAGVGKRGKKRGPAQGGAVGGDNFGNTIAGKRGRRGKSQGRGPKDGQALMGNAVGNAVGNAAGNVAGIGNSIGQPLSPHGDPRMPRGPRGTGGPPRTQSRKNTAGRKTPFRKMPMSEALVPSPSQVGDTRRIGEEAKSGQFAEALAAQANVKRERLHKVMAQSGIGSRRDMEIMISTGRVMVNGIVATTGTQVSPGDNVLVDQRPVKLKFSEELPRVLLYHKPEGEIVTTSDPGNRITVFDNLPPVETGKWIAIGRLDINTSGLLIFTTNGELANRFMHPRYEVEREYAVRILGELTEEQTQALLTGVNIDMSDADDEDDDGEQVPSAPARFDTIEKRGGEGANQWYQVTIKEGRNREVRKMFESQGLTVSRLIRTRFGKIELPPRLSRGKLMELSPDQVRSVLAGAGMKDEADAAIPVGGSRDARGGRGGRGARGPKPPREGQVGQGSQGGQGRQGGRPPRAGHAGPNVGGAAAGNAGGPETTERAERGNEPPRPRRNRRGGKGAKRDPNMVNAGGTAINANAVNDEGFGNRADSRGNVPPPFESFHETHEANGNAADAVGNIVNKVLPERPPGEGVPRKGPRGGRQRRNFRGRGGRNRGAKSGGEGGGEGGNGNSGGSGSGGGGERGGPSGGNSEGGNSDGGGSAGNSGGEGNS